MLRKLVISLIVAATATGSAAVGAAPTNTRPARPVTLGQIFLATAKYTRLSVAQHDQYGKLLDKDGIACIDMPGMGAMGVHYVNGDLVKTDSIDPLHPEALVYEPETRNRSRLVALEYIVDKAAWDAKHSTAPALFGHRFNSTPAGNRFGLPAYYSLHVWLFKHNPAGEFTMWNPEVHCK